jgi:hypothetical protein
MSFMRRSLMPPRRGPLAEIPDHSRAGGALRDSGWPGRDEETHPKLFVLDVLADGRAESQQLS